jgi:hypothetical protein
MAVGCILSVLSYNICDVYMTHKSARDLWEAIEHKYSASNAGHELYIMEKYHDYKMVDNRSVVEQAHEIQLIVRDLQQHGHNLSSRFVAGSIIAKLPPTWRGFATSMKHKRQNICVQDLLASLDMEEKARAKDGPPKTFEGQSSANFVQYGGQKKGKTKVIQTTNIKKKEKKKLNMSDVECFIYGKTEHFAKKCTERKGKKNQQAKNNSANIVVSEAKAIGYGNTYTVLTACHSIEWWIGANMHVCADISFFSSYQATHGASVLMGNGSRASVHGVGTVDLKFTSGKTVWLKNVQHAPSINKNLVSGSLLCQDGYKLVFESNKVVVFKCGLY